MKNKDRLMSIDPSINNLGVAVFEGQKLILYKLLHPSKDCRDTPYDKAISLFNKIKDDIKVWSVRRLILEIPEYWAVAGFHARETGAIFKLTFVCGALCTLVNDLEELKVVTPREWKGQLPKNVVANRLRDSYLPDVDLTKINENVMDAIGIGHFYLYGKV